MKSLRQLILLAASVTLVSAQQPISAQCGGPDYYGATVCSNSLTCAAVGTKTTISVCWPPSQTLPTFTWTTIAPPTSTFTLTGHPTFTVIDPPVTTTVTTTTTVICSTVTYTLTVTPTITDTTTTKPTTTPTTITDTTTTTQTTPTTITDTTTTIPTDTTTRTTTFTTNTTTITDTTTTTTQTSGCNIPPPKQPAKLNFTGINIAGIDFSTDINGNYNPAAAVVPLTAFGGADGAGQMVHFVKDDGFNIFRLPVVWQFLTGGTPGGGLDPTNFGEYQTLVKYCLSTGAYCVIDLHNYARFYGGIVGQGGPTDADFVNFWTQIASVYASTPNILFGLQNAPHDLNLSVWRNTLQRAVLAIRAAGAKTQIILLPGVEYANANTFISSGSASILNTITDPVGGTNLLVFDVHKYLDKPQNGTLPDCVEDGIASALNPLSQWLRCNKRTALITETGGGNTKTCLKYLCSLTAFVKANSDVFLGYIGWAAGNEPASYPLVETPVSSSPWTDQLIIQCLLP